MTDWVHRKEKIIYTAIEVIDELGVQALSTKRLAAYEHISESTIFKHFNNKQILMSAVLDFYSQYDRDLLDSVGDKGLIGSEGMYHYFEALLTYYENYPKVTAILQGLYEMKYIPGLTPKIKDLTELRTEGLALMIKSGMDKGEFRKEIDERLMAEMIWGSMIGLINTWRLNNGPFAMKDKCLQGLTYMIESMKATQGTGGVCIE